MKGQIRRHRQVNDDLIEIYAYIHRRSPEAAEKVFNALEGSIRSLLDTPGAGRLWRTSDPRLEGLRVTVCKPYRNYLIFFRRVADGIEVFRIVHGARELGRIVEEIEIELDENDEDDAPADEA